MIEGTYQEEPVRVTISEMEDVPMSDFSRITRDPLVMQGKACIRGMRVTVGMILGNLSGGATVEELLSDFPYLEREDIMQALAYGSWLASEREIRLDDAA